MMLHLCLHMALITCLKVIYTGESKKGEKIIKTQLWDIIVLFLTKYHSQFDRTFSLLTTCFKATKIANRGYKLSKIL